MNVLIGLREIENMFQILHELAIKEREHKPPYPHPLLANELFPFRFEDGLKVIKTVIKRYENDSKRVRKSQKRKLNIPTQ